ATAAQNTTRRLGSGETTGLAPILMTYHWSTAPLGGCERESNPRLQGPCSSFRHSLLSRIGVAGFEPAAPCARGRCAHQTAPHSVHLTHLVGAIRPVSPSPFRC